MSRLALPIVLAQVGLLLMGVVDTLMMGRVSPEALGAVALGNLYFVTLSIPCTGTLMVLDPLVAQAVGARDAERIALGIQRGIVLAAALTIVTSLLLWPVHGVLTALRQPPVLVALATPYVRISIYGVAPFLAFVVLRQSLQALHHVRALLPAVLVANLVNAGLNWVFVYGHLGSPAMGVPGSALATCVSRWTMVLLLFAGGWRTLRPALVPWRREARRLAPILQMVRLGAPIGFQQMLEMGVFSAIGVLMGILGTREMAAHQIALNLASLTFMVPLGVGAAAAVRVGHAAGEGDANAVRERARTALFCGVGFMLCTGVVLLLAPRAIASLYTTNLSVAALAATLIPIAGVFQVFDGVQAVSAGVLRGLGDTRAPFLINLAGFWLAGFPVSIALGFYTRLGALGLWWGLVAGLIAVSGLLLARVRSRLRAPIVRSTLESDVVRLATER
ncbi:MAG TPA: MATE family efflux transporter [Gemmatimonadaceae bacterium]|nr:MATE family efflux transporter [Gemmatimonadaceae bacterium]